MKKIILPIIALTALIAGYFASQYIAPKKLFLQSGTLIKTPMALPKVNLIDHNNDAFSNERFANKWTLMFFGFTNCPDVCPDSLNMLKTMYERLSEEDKKDIQIIFVSVDPDRDTTDKMKSYVTFFNPSFLGVTGKIENITALTKKLGIIHYIQGPKDSYDVAHSGSMTLINPQGEFEAVFSAPHDPEIMATDLINIRHHYL